MGKVWKYLKNIGKDWNLPLRHPKNIGKVWNLPLRHLNAFASPENWSGIEAPREL